MTAQHPEGNETPAAEFLPSAEQQAWLIDSLSELLRSRGPRHFLAMPLVEPTARFFPDRWSFSEIGLDRVVRRLMQYAGLGGLDVRITTFAHPGIARGRNRNAHRSIAGAFLGIEDDCCYFALNEEAPGDEEYVAGVMAHEVAHAYRTHHGLCDPSDPNREEWLTDVTAVYLGFGLLVANNSYRYRMSVEGDLFFGSFLSRSENQVGYLTPQAFAFLLAIQMQARALGRRQRNRVLRQLETTQSAFVKAAAKSILEWPDETFDRLQFPREGEPVEVVPLRAVLVPLPELKDATEEAPPEEDLSPGAPLFNLGRPIFRLRQSRTIQYSVLGVIAGLLIGAFAPAPAFRVWLLGTAPLIGLAAGLVAGRRRQFDICSDPECGSILTPEATTCSNCGGVIAGSIRRPSERLEAEERLEASRRAPRRKKARPRGGRGRRR